MNYTVNKQKSNICNRIRVSGSTVAYMYTPTQILHKYMIFTPLPPSPNWLSESFHCHRGWRKSRGFILWISILGEPGADSGGEGKSKRVGNMAWRKVKDGEKSPWGQCLTTPVPNGHRSSGFWLVPENFCVFLPNQKAERWWPFGTGLVRHCPQGLFSLFFTFLCAIFPSPPPPPFRLSLTPTTCPWVSEDDE